ncbi:hypothetical protein F5Y16DRAFT_369600 [Xylariaceae sp. FL0255]|nr:hypothetical protein F5Y16DRAFT_369600 [Xylariaceae sp. FL0255]
MKSEVVTNTYGIEFPPRYEIRRLSPEIGLWLHDFSRYVVIIETPLFGPIYKNRHPCRKLLTAKNLERPTLTHALESGLSYGLFDKEYQWKRPESAATGGAVYWDEIDPEDPDLEVAGPQRLLDAMDFPLAALSLSHDKTHVQSAEAIAADIAFLPEYADFGVIKKPASKPQDEEETTKDLIKPGEVLMRCGTTTKRDYGGQGLMKLMACFVTRDAHARGFKRIEVPIINEAVVKIYLNPPPPFTAELTQVVNVRDGEVERDGKMIKPFAESITKRYCHITVYLAS